MTNPAGRISRGVAVAALVAVSWSVVLLLIATVTSNEKVVQIATGLGAVVGLLGGALALLTNAGLAFRQRSLPVVTRQRAIRVVAALLVVNGLATVAWLSWSLYQANRAIDVTATVSAINNDDVLPGERATFEVETDGSRSHLVIVFRVDGTNPGIGTCLPNTRLSVTSSTSGNKRSTAIATPGEPLSIEMAERTQILTLDVQVQNIRDDRNCAVNVAVSSAELTNG